MSTVPSVFGTRPHLIVQGRRLPVLDIRCDADRGEIARRLATGVPAAFSMGLFTIVRLLRAVAGRDDGALFWRVKRGRPSWSKLPMFTRPGPALRLADFSVVHPEFRHLGKREAFAALWAHGAPLHVVVPVRQPLRLVPDSFITHPADLTAQAASSPAAGDRVVGVATASMFWMDDPAWHDLSVRLGVGAPPRCWLGGSSFNDHGAPPPFTLEELVVHTERRPDLPYEFVISDPHFEASGCHSSHSLVRLPLTDEPAKLVLLRRGSMAADWIEEATGYPVRVLPSAPLASRAPGTTDSSLRGAAEQLALLRGR